MAYERFDIPHSDLSVLVLGEPTHGGGLHHYQVVQRAAEGEDEKIIATIDFQNGPIGEFGVNGVTHEVMLAIVAHRLRSFQAGPYACDENREALELIERANEILYTRTRKRLERGVEGTRQL